MDRRKPEGGFLLQKGNTRTWPLWDTSDRGGCRRCSFASLPLALPSVTCPQWTCSLLDPLILFPVKHSTRLPLEATLSSEATLISLTASCSCCSPWGAEIPGHHSPRPLVTGATLCDEASGTSKHRDRQESLVATGMSSAQG